MCPQIPAAPCTYLSNFPPPVGCDTRSISKRGVKLAWIQVIPSTRVIAISWQKIYTAQVFNNSLVENRWILVFNGGISRK